MKAKQAYEKTLQENESFKLKVKEFSNIVTESLVPNAVKDGSFSIIIDLKNDFHSEKRFIKFIEEVCKSIEKDGYFVISFEIENQQFIFVSWLKNI